MSLDGLHGWTRHGVSTRSFTKYALCDGCRRWRCCLLHQFTALWCYHAELYTYVGESHLCEPSRQQDKGTRRQHFHKKHGHTLTMGILNLTPDLFQPAKEVWSKVMFSQVFVCPWGRGVSLIETLPGQRPPSTEATPLDKDPPRTETPLDRDPPLWTETPSLDRDPQTETPVR